MNKSAEDTYNSYYEYKAGILIWKIVPPILILCGTIGNLLSVVVLTRKSMWSTTTALFLIFLNFSDLTVLYTGLLRQWLIYLFQFDIRHVNEAACKINIWLVYSSLDFSAWILIAVTLERVIAVWWPYSRGNICSKRNALIATLTILLFLLGLNSHLLYGMLNKINENNVAQKCASIDIYYSNFFRSIWSWIDLCVFCLFPFVVIVIGNSLILFKICKRQRRPVPKIVSPEQQQNHTHSRHHHQSSMTAVLLTLNTVFVITTLPVSIYNIGYTHWHTTKDQQTIARIELWWAIVNMLMYTNNAINFVLYCLSGSRFRQEFKRILCQRNTNTENHFKASMITPNQCSPNQEQEGDERNINQRSYSLNVPDLKQRNISNTSGFGSCNTLCSDCTPTSHNNDISLNLAKTQSHAGNDTDENELTAAFLKKNYLDLPSNGEETLALTKNISESPYVNIGRENDSRTQVRINCNAVLNTSENNPYSKLPKGIESMKSGKPGEGERIEKHIPLTIGNLNEALETENETTV